MPKRRRHRQRATAAAAAAPPASVPVPAPARPGLPPLIDTPQLAADLARHLLDPARARTVIVVTRPSGSDRALVDIDDIRAQVGALVDVHEMTNGPVGLTLSGNLPDRASVYGGASRTYPVGWNGSLDGAPLRFVWNRADAARITEQVISDALHASHQTAAAQPARLSRRAAGRVLGVAGNRALVALDGGGTAAVRPELTADGVDDAARLFTPGMRVDGLLDEVTGWLDVAGMVRPADEALAGYRAGVTVLGRVMLVASSHADVMLHPQVVVRMLRDHIVDPARPSRIVDLLTKGETVAAVVTGTPADPAGRWQLDLTGVDPDTEPVEAPALLPGGPAWLVPPPPVAAETEPEPEPEPEPGPAPLPPAPPAPAAVPAPAVPADQTAAALMSMTAERDQLLRELADVARRSDRAEADLARARVRAREAEAALAQAKRKLGAAEAAVDLIEREGTLFADPEEQLRFEVQLAWARRIPAAEKVARPLGRYSVGPEFVETLHGTEGVDRAKVVDVIVEIVTGLVHEVAGRELHQLRTGSGPEDPPRTRPDGATCWRVSLQVKSPQARRLHYWMLNDGTVELSSVRVHDDFRP